MSDLSRVLTRRGILDVWHLDDRPRQNRHAGRGIRIQGPRVPRAGSGERLGRTTVICWVVERLAVGKKDPRTGRVAEPSGAPHDRVEHRLRICLSMRDRSQNFARRRLLFQSLGDLFMGEGQRAVFLLELREQSHVLDGNDGLVGERLQQASLLVGERVHIRASELDDADRCTLAHEGNTQRGAKTHLRREGARFGELLRLSLEVGDLNGSLLQHGTPAQGAPHDRKPEVHGLGDRAMVGGWAQVISVNPQNGHVVGSAEARGALQHCVQNGLQIRR